MPSTDSVGDPDSASSSPRPAPASDQARGWSRVRSWLLPPDHTGGGYWQVLRHDSPRVGFCLLFVFASGWGQTFLLSLFQPHWMRDLGLSPGAMGTLYGGATLASGLCLPWAGRWLDRVRPTVAGLVTLGGLTAFSLLAAGTTQIWMLALAVFGLRFFGQGLSSTFGITNAARWFTTNRGKAVSLAGLGFPLAEGLLPGLVTFALVTVGWRWTWGLLAAVCVVIFIPLAAALAARHPPAAKDVAAVRAQHTRAIAARRGVLRDRRFYLMLGLQGPLPFIGTGLILFQAILAADRGWHPAVFPTGFLLFAVVRALCSLSAGAWVDRLGAVRLLALPSFFFATGLACLLRPEPAWTYAFFVLFGMSHGTAGAIGTAAWVEMFGSDAIGAIRGMSSSFAIFLTAAAPVAFGHALDRGVSINAIVLACGLMVLVITWPFSLMVRHAHRKRGPILPVTP